MEWAFAGAKNVQQDITDIILKALAVLRPAHSYQTIRGERVPDLTAVPESPTNPDEPQAHQITRMTFAEAIASYGIDKPDLRIPSRVSNVLLIHYAVFSPDVV